MQNFRALGAPPVPQTPVPPAAGGEALRSPASGSWGPRPQAPIGLRWREAPPPEPKISPPPHCEVLATRLVPVLVKTFFWSSLEFGEKSVPFLVKTLFFPLHFICSPEKNRGRGSSPQC